MKRKKYPWQDKEYLLNNCSYKLGIKKEEIPKRYSKLFMDIESVLYRLEYYCFIDSSGRAIQLLHSFIIELRKTLINKPVLTLKDLVK